LKLDRRSALRAEAKPWFKLVTAVAAIHVVAPGRLVSLAEDQRGASISLQIFADKKDFIGRNFLGE
jgi:hypothetical protein